MRKKKYTQFHTQGMLHARGCFILYADADGATKIEYLWNLEKEMVNLINQCYVMENEDDTQTTDSSNSNSNTNNNNNNNNNNKNSNSNKNNRKNTKNSKNNKGSKKGKQNKQNKQNNNKNKQNNNNNNSNNNSNDSLSPRRSMIDYFKYSEYDGVSVGSRKDLQKEAEANRAFYRNVAMWGFHYCVKYIAGVDNIRDTQCGFKMFTRNAVKNIFLYQKIRRWCFDVELLMIAQMQDIPMIEVGVAWDEIPGSKLSVIKASLSMFRELIIMRFFKMIGQWYKLDVQ